MQCPSCFCTAEQVAEIRKGVALLEERTKYYQQVAIEEATLAKRLGGVGSLSHEDAVRLGAIGPTGRASQVDRDVRRDDPYAAYGEMSFQVVTDTHCDVYGRTLVRVGELIESCKIIRQVLDNLPQGPITVRAPRRIPVGEAVIRYEAPRGEDVHYLRGNGTDKPERMKVRAPTLANVQAVAKMLEGNYLADVPLVIAAIDPCFSCTDRMIVARDAGGRKTGVMDWKSLRDYSVDWYKKNRGLDCSRIKLRA